MIIRQNESFILIIIDFLFKILFMFSLFVVEDSWNPAITRLDFVLLLISAREVVNSQTYIAQL